MDWVQLVVLGFTVQLMGVSLLLLVHLFEKINYSVQLLSIFFYLEVGFYVSPVLMCWITYTTLSSKGRDKAMKLWHIKMEHVLFRTMQYVKSWQQMSYTLY